MENKLLVTGGTGFVGKNLVPYLAKLDADIFILSRNCNFEYDYKNVKLIECDLLNQSEVKRTLKSLKASHLMHLAWNRLPGNSHLPENLDMVKAGITLLEEFEKNKGKRVIMVGSCAEYKWKYGFCRENSTPLSYNTLYASSKNMLRQYAFSFCKHYELEIAWARLFFLFGPHETQQRLIPHIITSILEGKQAIINNGELYRDYMYIKDCVNALSELTFSSFQGVMNICSGKPANLAEIGKLIAELAGRPELLKITNIIHSTDMVVYGKTKRLWQELSFEPEYDLKTGFKETIDWWRERGKLPAKI